MSVSGNCMRQLHEGVECEDQMNVGKKMGREREESNPWKCKAGAKNMA